MNVVDRMARLAMIAHNGVNRKGLGNKPYIVHPHAVVAMLKDMPVRLWSHGDLSKKTFVSSNRKRTTDGIWHLHLMPPQGRPYRFL